MEKRIEVLTQEVHGIPSHIERVVREALAAHESKDADRVRAISDALTVNLLVSLLGEDLATGQNAAQNRRALQEMLRQGVMVAPFLVRMRTRFMGLLGLILVGLVVASFVGAGLILEFIKTKFGVGP